MIWMRLEKKINNDTFSLIVHDIIDDFVPLSPGLVAQKS